jgi:hypothetical protein
VKTPGGFVKTEGWATSRSGAGLVSQEQCDLLLRAVVEDLKIFAAQIRDRLAALILCDYA